MHGLRIYTLEQTILGIRLLEMLSKDVKKQAEIGIKVNYSLHWIFLVLFVVFVQVLV